jgi:hypothetical protein
MAIDDKQRLASPFQEVPPKITKGQTNSNDDRATDFLLRNRPIEEDKTLIAENDPTPKTTTIHPHTDESPINKAIVEKRGPTQPWKTPTSITTINTMMPTNTSSHLTTTTSQCLLVEDVFPPTTTAQSTPTRTTMPEVFGAHP